MQSSGSQSEPVTLGYVAWLRERCNRAVGEDASVSTICQSIDQHRYDLEL